MAAQKKDWVQLPFLPVDLRDTNYCSKCELNCNVELSFVPFEIVGKNPEPDILFIAESPFYEEIKYGRPLIGKAGTLLRDFLSDYLDQYALANTVACHPTDTSTIHKPTKDMIAYCSVHVKKFMEQIKPKIVVMLGEHAIRGFLPEPIRSEIDIDNFRVGDLVRRKPQWIEGVLYACMYHPSYIVRNGGLKPNNPKAVDYRKRFESILEMSPVAPDMTNSYTVTRSFHGMNQLLMILRALENCQDIGLDYEALDLDPWKVTNKPTGFSLSHVVEGKKGRAYFVSIDRDPALHEREALLDFFKKKSIWTYNAKYEMNMTWAWLGRRVHFNDAFCLCKIDCSPSSLKANAQKYIEAELWEEDVYDIVGLYEEIFEQMTKLTPEFPEIIQVLRSGRFDDELEAEIAALGEKKAKKFNKLRVNIGYLLEVIEKKDFLWGLQKYPYQWGAVPTRILGEYCCWDSFLTLKLKEHFWERYSQYYPYYRSQTWLAGTMEAYGYNWDDIKAEELSNYYFDEAITCLYELIKRIDVDDIKKIEAQSAYGSPVLSRLEKLDALKKIFNPMSNDPKAQAPFWSFYRTPEVETWAFFVYLEHEILQHEDLEDQRFIKAINKENFDETVRNMYTIAKSADENAAVTTILRKASAKLDLYFNRFAIEVTEFQYEAHTKYGNVDIDDESTWNPQFYMLYYLKRFKKVLKSESTYIRGKIGRKFVSLAKYSGLTEPPRRVTPYFECPTHKLEDNERWILNATFFENGADTKRWRAGIHTVPANSELREIYTPRSKTAVMLHVDYAQNEVRFLAALANETNLLAAFDSGVDIHRFVASKIFKCTPKEVTGDQRRWAKAGTFGLLYGKTVVSFAQDMMGGDLDAAQRFFDDFFNAFPGISTYIEACHKQVLKHGFVNAMFGDPIYIDQTRYREDEVLRRSQNYPIQSSASSLGAHAISLLSERVLAKGLQAIPLGFCHDAADWEVDIKCLLQFIDLMHSYMVTHIRERYNVPVGVDWGIGIHQNHTMDLHKHNDEEGLYTFSCAKTTFEEIVARLRTHFVVDYTIIKTEEEFNSLAGLFQSKRAFSKYLGQRIPKYEGEIRLTVAA